MINPNEEFVLSWEQLKELMISCVTLGYAARGLNKTEAEAQGTAILAFEEGNLEPK